MTSNNGIYFEIWPNPETGGYNWAAYDHHSNEWFPTIAEGHSYFRKVAIRKGREHIQERKKKLQNQVYMESHKERFYE